MKTIFRIQMGLIALLIGLMPMQVQAITTIAGQSFISGSTGDGGLATAAKLGLVTSGVGVDRYGNLYIPSNTNHTVRKIDVATGVISKVVGTTFVPGFFGDGAAATAAALDSPGGITVDSYGNLYIADTRNHAIRKVNPAGTISTIAGTGTLGNTGDGGLATAATLDTPKGITLDSYGNLYIADWGNNRVRKIDAASGNISAFAGTGTLGNTGDGALATLAAFSGVTDIAVDVYGNVFIVDSLNHSIRKVDTAGVITTVAGTGVPGFSGDGGLATAATLDTPKGIAVDAKGALYIADTKNYRIRRVSPFGKITTFIGTGLGGGAVTSVNLPEGVSVDTYGDVYISDTRNYTLKKEIVDKIAPQAFAIYVTRPVTNQLTMSISHTTNGPSCTDNVSCVGVRFSTDNVNWSSFEAISALTPAWTMPPGDGVKDIYAQFNDAADNISNATHFQITVDTVAPATPTIQNLVNQSVAQNVTSVDVYADATTTVLIVLDNQTYFVPGSAGVWHLTDVNLMGLNSEGVHTLVVESTDAAGNKAASAPVTYTVDRTAPLINFTGTDQAVLNVGDTVNILSYVSASDDIEGDLSSNITVNGTVPTSSSPAATYNVTFSVVDSAGNSATSPNFSIILQDSSNSGGGSSGGGGGCLAPTSMASILGLLPMFGMLMMGLLLIKQKKRGEV